MRKIKMSKQSNYLVMEINADVLVVDATVAGISGDMLSAALLALYPAEDQLHILNHIRKAIQATTGYEFSMSLIPTDYLGIGGYRLELHGHEQVLNTQQLNDHYTSILNSLNITGIAADIGQLALDTILTAEKSVHEQDKVHLHELGTLDTLIDLVIPVYVIHDLSLTAIEVSPVATGHGQVKTSHGILPVPVPVVDHILKQGNFLVHTGPEGEATTPTGISLLYAMKSSLDTVKMYSIEHSALGFGTKIWSDRGNFVRVRLGISSSTAASIVMLETNVDDVEGEFMGYAIDRLMDQGALDISYYPIYMKKNRPAYCIRVLCEESQTDVLADELMKITGSLGIRIQPITRHIGTRSTKVYDVYVKELSAQISFKAKVGPYRTKIEFDDIRRISETYGVPIIRTKMILEKYLE